MPERLSGHFDESTDVLVVGTGAGGAVVAAELAQAGAKVMLVEEGDYHYGKDFRPRVLDQVKMLYRDFGLTGALGNTFISIPLGRAVGGTTVINSGTCWPAPADVLDSWESEHGIPGLSNNGLADEYAKVAKTIHVSKVSAENLGPGAKAFRQGAEKLGFTGEVIPRNAAGCKATGVCAFGCPLDAKQSMNVSYVPRAIQAGAQLCERTRVRRVLIKSGRAVGVEAHRLDAHGKAHAKLHIRADRVVICAGALLTPVLLARSGRSCRSGALGRNLRIHPSVRITARFDSPKNPWQGVPQSYHLSQFESERIFIQGMSVPPEIQAVGIPGFGHLHKARMAAYNRTASFGALISDTSRGRVFSLGGKPLVWYWLNTCDTGRLLRAVSLTARVFFAAGANEVYSGIRQQPVLRSMAEAEQLEDLRIRPNDLELMAFHPMGTARMGANPARSVVSPSGEMHTVKGLYVADASIFPSSTRVNPQMTIMAMATRIATQMAGK